MDVQCIRRRLTPVPDLDAALGVAGSSNLLPEQATHVDLGVEEKLAGGLRWQATLFNRIEHDGLRPPDLQPRLVQGLLVAPPGPGDYRNSLHGLSRGLDLLVAGEGTARLSGWMSYTYALTRQTDVETLETFWSDFDRRHVFNAAGRFQIGDQSSAGLVLRAASGVPIPGYFALSNGTLVAGENRNQERLPPYVRLDARLQRTFFSSRHPLILFGEVVNALNRRNLGTADGFIQPVTANAIGFSRPLLPRRASLGIEIDLSGDTTLDSDAWRPTPCGWRGRAPAVFWSP